jgi:hypothetical protein
MNDLTKEEIHLLDEILSGAGNLRGIDNKSFVFKNCLKKVRSMLDNYCAYKSNERMWLSIYKDAPLLENPLLTNGENYDMKLAVGKWDGHQWYATEYSCNYGIPGVTHFFIPPLIL